MTSARVPAAVAAAALLMTVSATGRQAVTPPDTAIATLRWFKGNTHTHTLNSDGDSTPDDVVRWYREHGYAFLVLTDHNYVTGVDGLNALHGAVDRFLVVKGEEVSDTFGQKPLHINGLDLRERVNPQGGSSVVDVLQRNVTAIRAANGVPHINHPNFRWAMTTDELRQVRDNKLFEIFNGHPEVNSLGGGGVPGLEEVWDAILTSGQLLYGIAVDDAHNFKRPGDPNVAGPGRGWVVVRAARLETRALLEAMERGDFYASTGVELTDYQATPRQITVSVKATAYSKYRVQFIGKGGKVLREVAEPLATYGIGGDEGYVRARVIESNGRMAWCQPMPVRPPSQTPAGKTVALMAGVAAIAALVRFRTPSVR